MQAGKQAAAEPCSKRIKSANWPQARRREQTASDLAAGKANTPLAAAAAQQEVADAAAEAAKQAGDTPVGEALKQAAKAAATAAKETLAGKANRSGSLGKPPTKPSPRLRRRPMKL
ncbi:MAG: hypothetical protein R3C99_13545 [Pirellulaceae bacterium]